MPFLLANSILQHLLYNGFALHWKFSYRLLLLPIMTLWLCFLTFVGFGFSSRQYVHPHLPMCYAHLNKNLLLPFPTVNTARILDCLCCYFYRCIGIFCQQLSSHLRVFVNFC